MLAPWTLKYFTSQKIGHVYEAPAVFDDIELLESETPNELPKIVSIEVKYNDRLFWGYKVNYDDVETVWHMSTDDYIPNVQYEKFDLSDGDYIVEAGARAGWAMDAFWFKTK